MTNNLPSVIPPDDVPDRPQDREAFSTFCARLAERDSIQEACRAAGKDWRWLWDYKAHRIEREAEYRRARSYSGHSWADHSSQVAADATPETVHVARLQEDNARWRATVANRREFGSSVDVTSDGEAMRPAVVILPPLAPMPVMPGASITVTERQITVTGSSVGARLAAALEELRTGRRLLGPSETQCVAPTP